MPLPHAPCSVHAESPLDGGRQLPRGHRLHSPDTPLGQGTQYCCDEYTKYLHSLGIQISTTQDGNPLDNAIAERINGILMVEAIKRVRLFTDISETREKIGGFIIEFYNKHRPHRSIGMSTPNKIYGGQIPSFLNCKDTKNLYLRSEGSVNLTRK